MSIFLEELRRYGNSTEGRDWLYLPYDQLSSQIGPLSRRPPEELGIILIENRWKPRLRPYHKQKLALILANMRHFALEQAARGVAVEYIFGDAPYREILKPILKRLGGAEMMEPAERELRQDLEGLQQLTFVRHEGWLTTPEQFQKSQANLKTWRMDSFYRHIRKETGILMNQGQPEGGKLSHDADNRQAWKGDPPAPSPPTFPLDPIKTEVAKLVESEFQDHPGSLRPEYLPATHKDAQFLWQWAKEQCMTHFGPFEDAMSSHSSGLFHTRLSPLLNIHRLLPAQILREALELDIPLNSKEGFVRQILGWREFMNHVHRETDGFRDLSQHKKASSNFFEAHNDLPPAFWGKVKSGMNCLDTVVGEVWEEGYSHHITRLMVLANLATLFEVDPRQITDWFWVAYCDAFDWVVEPNVLGMGTYSLGELFTTKPYISGSSYINRMSDYCKSCAFHHQKTCPVTPMFWSFLERHSDRLKNNNRMSLMLRNVAKRSADKKAEDERITNSAWNALQKGESLCPLQLHLFSNP